MADYETLMAKARELSAAGKTVDARRVAEIALKTRQSGPATKPLAQRLKENLFGDDDPTTQNLGEKVGTFLNKAGESMTFGLVGDEASAAFESLAPGVNYDERRDHYRQQEEQFDKEHPVASLTADLGGAMALPGFGLAKAGGSLAKRALTSGVATGAMSGVHGFAEGEGGAEKRISGGATDAGVGAIVGAGIPFVGAGAQKIADTFRGRQAIKQAAAGAPTTEQLRQQGRAAYQAIDDAGVQVNPAKIRSGLDDIVAALKEEGAGYTGAEKVLPASRSIMEAADDVGSGANSVPFKELDIFRRYAGNAAGSNLANKADTRAATQAVTSLDDMVQGLKPGDIDAGDLDVLQTMLPKAREVWSRMSRSQTIDDAIEAGGNYQSGSASGIRNQFQRILKNPKLSRGFSDAERKMMQKVVNGGALDTLLKYAGSGLGMMGTVGGGAAVGGLPGMIIGGGVAAGARKLSESVANKNADIVRAVIANGGMKSLPKADPRYQAITEQLLRRATSGSIPR
jgi:hypothetical protein